MVHMYTLYRYIHKCTTPKYNTLPPWTLLVHSWAWCHQPLSKYISWRGSGGSMWLRILKYNTHILYIYIYTVTQIQIHSSWIPHCNPPQSKCISWRERAKSPEVQCVSCEWWTLPAMGQKSQWWRWWRWWWWWWWWWRKVNMCSVKGMVKPIQCNVPF